MSNVLNEEKKQQVIALGRLGWSLRRIQQSTGVRRQTAGVYVRSAGISVRPPGAWGRPSPAKPANEVITDSTGAKSSHEPAPGLALAKPANEVITDSDAALAPAAKPPEPRPGHSPSASASTAYRDVIEVGLSRGRNAMAIWQDLIDTCHFPAGYQSVRRFIRKLQPSPSPEARVVIETAPGEELQVDYGTGPMVRDAATSKYRRTRLFVLTLGYSRKCVRLLTFRSSSQIWAELHEKAFRRLGGVTRVIVMDNLREGVLAPDIYDPTINPLYRDVLQHYQIVPLPCRVADPDRKGKVERSVGHAKNTPLKGLRFESLEGAQGYLDHWETRWADTRIHGTTKRQVGAMFAEDGRLCNPCRWSRSATTNMASAQFTWMAAWRSRRLTTARPQGWIGRRVQVQWDAHQVRILSRDTGQLLREHLRQARGRHRIQDQDRPKQTPLGTLQLLARADQLGSQVGALCRGMHHKDGETAIRRILGVLSLAKKHGAATLEDACTAALEVSVYDYHFVRRYLERRPQLPLTLRQVDPLIRQLTLYRDFIESKTQQESET